MTLIDTHCHLNHDNYQEDLDQVLLRAQNVGVEKMITICTELAEASALLNLAQNHPQIFCTIGVHPHEAKAAMEQGDLKQHIEQFAQKTKVVGLGETGLDYFYEHSPKEEQRQAFQIHIDLAQTLSLPLVVHTRDAEKDTIDLLSSTQNKLQGVIHCFSGTQWLANQALKLGFYISVSGIVTFKKADDLRQIIQSVPLEYLLIETDAPYLAPTPLRGKRNEPAFILHTAQVVADIKGISLAQLAEITTANAQRLFKL